jgi:hypothetical protein
MFEDHTVTAGDYSAGSPHSAHRSSTTARGWVLFVVHNDADQHYAQ